MFSFTRVGMFVEVCAIKFPKSMNIFRKMRGHPIQNYADAIVMAMVNKIHKILRLAKTTCGRKIPRHLISPRTVKRMLHHGHQLDVRKAMLLDIRDETLGKLSIRKPTISFFGNPCPRAKVHFVHRHWFRTMVIACSLLHPIIIAPRKTG